MVEEWGRNKLAVQLGNIASEAGAVIMARLAAGFEVIRKADDSPVTDADIEAERIIRARLAAMMPGIDVIAEESFDRQRSTDLPYRFILVDPLDGTREFLSGSDQFTVNIALIEGGVPIAGCVYAPAGNRIYVAGEASYAAAVRPGDLLPPPGGMRLLRARSYSDSGLCAVVSRSHLDSETEQLLSRLPIATRESTGSSLKFCLVAEAQADIYPRLAPTMEWDTAAGHAILSAAGGCVMTADGHPLRYGKLNAGLVNDGFVAWGGSPLPFADDRCPATNSTLTA